MAIKRVDMTTGEVLEEYYSKKFWKCYRKGFLDILRLIKNQQLQVFIHICENVTTSKNEFIGSYEKIAKAINKAQNANTKVAKGSDKPKISKTTIAKTMKLLKEANFIKKVQNTVWMVNPDIFMQGSDSKRGYLSDVYNCKDFQDNFLQERKDLDTKQDT